jgi:deoxyribose-phosphate aldolase
MSLASAHDLARTIDISCVRAHHGPSDITELAGHALQWGCINAHVLPNWLPVLAPLLSGSTTLPAAPIGFPSGGSTTETKCRETEYVLEAGAQEVDVVLNIGRLIGGDVNYVTSELREIMALIPPSVITKGIIETSLLSPEHIQLATRMVADAGCGFVKTGTGWAGPVTVKAVVEIASALKYSGHDGVEIKAAGGIRTLSDISSLKDAGVTRFGIGLTSAVNILEETSQA